MNSNPASVLFPLSTTTVPPIQMLSFDDRTLYDTITRNINSQNGARPTHQLLALPVMLSYNFPSPNPSSILVTYGELFSTGPLPSYAAYNTGALWSCFVGQISTITSAQWYYVNQTPITIALNPLTPPVNLNRPLCTTHYYFGANANMYFYGTLFIYKPLP